MQASNLLLPYCCCNAPPRTASNARLLPYSCGGWRSQCAKIEDGSFWRPCHPASPASRGRRHSWAHGPPPSSLPGLGASQCLSDSPATPPPHLLVMTPDPPMTLDDLPCRARNVITPAKSQLPNVTWSQVWGIRTWTSLGPFLCRPQPALSCGGSKSPSHCLLGRAVAAEKSAVAQLSGFCHPTAFQIFSPVFTKDKDCMTCVQVWGLL